MPTNALTTPNEEYSYDVCPEFSGGMASAPRANLLEINQASLLQNCEYDTQGILRTRRGTRQFQSTASPGFLGGIAINLPDNKVVTTVDGSGNLRFCYAPNVTGAVPGSNGFGPNHTGLTGVAATDIITDNAHGYSDGYRVAFSAITGGAGLVVGTQYFVINSTANTYQLSPTSGGAVVNFTTDITAATINSVGLFAAGAYVASTHGQTGAYYSDGQNFLAYCDGQTVVTNTVAPIGSLIAWHTNRLFVAGIPGRPNTLKCSGILNDKLWLGNFSIDVGTNDGDRIVGLLSYQDFLLVVFKQNSVWIVDADPTATNAQGQLSAAAWQIQSVPGALGCVAPRTVAVVGNDVWFLAQDGVRVLQRAQFVTAQFSIVDPVSQPLRDYIRRFNRTAEAQTACAISFNGIYLISLPLDGSLTNTITLVYRQITKSWQGVWTIAAQHFMIDTLFRPNRLLISTTDNLMREYLDYYQDFQADPSCFQDVGVGVQSIVRTRAMIFGEIVSPKDGQFWEVEFYLSRSGATAIAACADAGTDVPLLSIDTELAPAIQVPFTLPVTLPATGVKKRGSNLRQLNTSFREVQMVITNTDLLPISFRYCSAVTTVQAVRFETL